MDTLPVTLIVKASNQQFEDQTIKCELTWSIRKLKGYLSEVYPCNPTLEEQKLIYSGKLLNDAHILKDVLLKFEGQEDIHTHTVHLVYTPKNKNLYSQKSAAAKSSQQNKDAKEQQQNMSKTRPQQQQSTQQQTQQPQTQTQAGYAAGYAAGSDGLRQRNVNSSASQNNIQPAMQAPSPFENGLYTSPQHFMPGMPIMNPLSMPMAASATPQTNSQYTPEQYAIAQQVAMQNMMHQMYWQYLNHYANSVQQSATGQNVNYPQQPLPMPYFPQNVGAPLAPGFNMGADATLNAQYSNAYERTAADVEQQQHQQQQQQQPPVQPQVQAQRLQNNGGDDDAENRDWLEILYTFSRLIVLLSLVYFYSSPGRISIVIFVLVLYYFYQTHQRNLRERQQNEVENQQMAAALRDFDADVIDGAVENNEPVAQPNDAEPIADNNVANGEAMNNTTETSSISSSVSSVEQEENNRLPTVTLLRTFILSFFASLIPETPAV